MVELAALHKRLLELEECSEAFSDVREIDWADPELGRRFLRFGRRSDEDTVHELSFLEALLSATPNARVLDFMCGDGRLSLPLAERGYCVHGVDINPYVIDLARASAAQTGAEASFEVADLRTWKGEGTFDVAICIFGHLSGFPRQEAQGILSRVWERLAPGGTLLIGMHLSENVLRELDGQRDWGYFPDGWLGTDSPALVLDDYCCDPFALTFVRRSLCLDLKSGALAAFGQAGQFYTPATMSTLLDESGFEALRFWGGFDGELYDVGRSSNLIVSARKISDNP